eukprot:12695522-Ditylum_brightwellii.AAC.1
MKLFDGVTAVLKDDEQVRLFGIKKGMYSSTLADNKAVANNHFVCEAGWQLDYVAKRHLWLPNGDTAP